MSRQKKKSNIGGMLYDQSMTWPLYGMLAIVALTPYFRGLFFTGEQLVASALAGLCFAAGWWTLAQRNRIRLCDTWTEVMVLGLNGLYTLGFFTGVNTRSALQGAILWAMYWMVFWLISRYATAPRAARLIWITLVATATVLALVGIGAAAGVVHYPGAFEGRRIASTLQYPNTLAVYLGVGLIGSFTLWVASAHARQRGILSAAGVLILTVFVFTFSRGAWLLLPVGLLLLVAVLPAGKRAPAFGAIMAAAVPAAAILIPVGNLLPKVAPVNPSAGLLFWTAAGVLGGYLGGRVADRLLRATPQVQKGSALVIGTAVVSLVTFAAVRVPQAIAQRISDINLQALSVQERFTFYRDAWHMAQERLFLGWGGGGWAAAYQGHQTFGYTTSLIHNHFLEVMVEVGVIGFLLFTGFWMAGWWFGWRGSKTLEAEHAVMVKGALVAVTWLGMHSAIDFNLSLAAVSLALWSLFGIVNGAVLRTQPSIGPEQRAVGYGWAAPVLALGLSVGALVLFGGFTRGAEAARQLNQQQLDRAFYGYQAAVRLDPWTASFHADLGQILKVEAQKNGNAQADARARAELVRALDLDGYNPFLHEVYGDYLLVKGDLQGGLAEMEKVVELNPFKPQHYERLARAYYLAGRALVERSRRNEATAYLEKIPAVQTKMRAKHLQVPAYARHRPMPETTPEVSLRVGQAYALLGRWDQAVGHLNAAIKNSQLKGEAAAWLARVHEVSGDAAKAASLQKIAFGAGGSAEYEKIGRLLRPES